MNWLETDTDGESKFISLNSTKPLRVVEVQLQAPLDGGELLDSRSGRSDLFTFEKKAPYTGGSGAGLNVQNIHIFIFLENIPLCYRTENNHKFIFANTTVYFIVSPYIFQFNNGLNTNTCWVKSACVGILSIIQQYIINNKMF